MVGRAAATTRDDVLARMETELAVLARRLESLSRRSTIHRDLDRAGYLLARALADDGPGRISGLAQRLGLDATTVTRQVAVLEDEGLVRRQPDPSDARVSIIELSARGRRRMERVRTARRSRVEDLVAGWSERDRATFATLLARFNTAVREASGATAAARARRRPGRGARTGP